MHKLWLRALLPVTSNFDKQHKITLKQTTISDHQTPQQKKRRCLASKALLHLSSKLILQHNNQARHFQRNMKSIKQHSSNPLSSIFRKVSTHHTTFGLINRQQTTQNKLPIHTIRNIIINQHILILGRFLHSLS
jgi:hypothetical protein